MRGNRLIRFFISVLALLVYAALSGYGLNLLGRSTVVLGHDDIVLGDVATVSDGAAAVEATRLNLHIPYPVLFSPEGLVPRLEEVLAEPVIYSGGAVKVIPRLYSEGIEGAFLEKLLRYIETAYSETYLKIEIIPNRGLPAVGKAESVDFVLLKNGSAYEVLYRRLDRASYRKVYATVRITELAGTYAGSPHPFDGDERAVYAEDLRVPADRIIRSGQRVAAVFSSGSIRMEVPASALESGAMMQLIKIKLDESGKEVIARVVGQSEVRIDL